MSINEMRTPRAIVLSRMEELLLEDDFELSIDYLKHIHQYLFTDIIANNGEFRTRNIYRNEDILNERSVSYTDYNMIDTYLTFYLETEKEIDYSNYSLDETAKSIANFTSKIWQVHPFSNGNTRTVCVFIQKYLKKLGYEVDNNRFNKNSTYFRNTLVLSAYQNQKLEIDINLLPLTRFIELLLKNEPAVFNNYSLFIEKLLITKTKKRTLKRK